MKTKLLLICIAMLSMHTYGQFSEQKTISTLADEVRSVYAVDLDGDGDIDVLSASFRDDEIAWYENTDGKGTFTTQQKIAIDVDGATSVYAADLDGDGDVDVLSASQNDGKIAWFENIDGKGNFGAQKRVTNDAKGASSVFAADFDGDGKMDVLFASRIENRIAWHKNVDNQPGDFGDQQIITKEAMGAASVYAVDVDGDGDMDVLSASTGDNTIAWYENTDSKGTFSDKQIITINASVTSSVYAADLDGDGDIDVLSAAAGGDQIAWYENTDGKGSFGAQQVISILTDSALSVYAADVDDDGDIDVLSASQYDDKIAWYENTDGQGNFGTQQIITSSADGANSVFAADIDGDGKLDVLSASKNDDKIAWYQNLTGPKTYVPDNNFEQALIDLGYDTVLDDYVLTTNINTITSLNISSKNIADLSGIEGFTALQELRCHYNELTSLDVNQNTALTFLSCGFNQLSSLDVTQNTALEVIGCSSNQLTSLDVSQNTVLEYLSCEDNQLTSLGLSQNLALTDLYCSENQLTSLDVTQNTALEVIACRSNQLSSLDLSQNTALIRLWCYSNQLTSLNVKNGNNVNLSIFQAYSNPNLTCIEVDDAAWSTANWTNIDATSTFSEDCNAALTYVPDDNFEQALIDKGYDTVLDDYVLTANIETITNLNIPNKNITDLTGIEDFVALQELRCHYNELTSLDVRENIALTELICHDNQLTNLDQNLALTDLWCQNNQLTNIDLSQNVVLTRLRCNNNQLTSLDVSHNTALTLLWCHYNELTSLDVSQNTALIEFICNNNQLTSLDMDQHSALTRLWCFDNQMTSLNVKNGNNDNVTSFSAKNNPNLTCIEVDDAVWSTANWTAIDATSTFVNSQAECDVLAVSDEVLNNAIAIYPNPATAIFKIKSDVDISKINVFDSLGRLVLQFNQQENYNISNLTKGIYFIRLKSDEKSYQQKLIIQ